MAKKNTGMAFLAVFLGWIGVLIAVLTQRDDKYVMYYTKQSLALIIADAAIALIGVITILIGIVTLILLVGFVILAIGLIILFGGLIITRVLWVIAWINALSGKEKKLPLLQWLADKFDF